MEYTPISPFGRPIRPAQLKPRTAFVTGGGDSPVDKWEALRALSKAQAAFGLTERDITVLQGLLSFFPKTALVAGTDLVVFPSNKTLCERLNGMACSTMRRHLARLVDADVIGRRDSPNGKRYVRRHGEARVAYGLDLTPLAMRFAEFSRIAEETRAEEERIRSLRETVSLMRRDLAALADCGKSAASGMALWDLLQDTALLTARTLRRKLSAADLEALRNNLADLLGRAKRAMSEVITEQLSSSDVHNEQHCQRSDKDNIESENALIEIVPEHRAAPMISEERCIENRYMGRNDSDVPFELVREACPALRTFYPGDIGNWRQLCDAAAALRPAMGVGSSVWEEAKKSIGFVSASIVLAAMLERFSEIRSPGAYLRALTSKAAAGAFSCRPMIRALLRNPKVA